MMIATTSIETSKKIFELTGWGDTKFNYWRQGPMEYLAELPSYPIIIITDGEITECPYLKDKIAPAYDLSYLLERLPPRIQDSHGTWFALMGYPNGMPPWFAYKSALEGENSRWPNDQGIPYYKRVFQADTPVEAAGLLVIALAEQGLLGDG